MADILSEGTKPQQRQVIHSRAAQSFDERTDGSAAFPATFDSAMPFCGGVAAVETFQIIGKTVDMCRAPLFKGKHGIIDHSANYVWRDTEEQTS